jgi:hypothetical protein
MLALVLLTGPLGTIETEKLEVVFTVVRRPLQEIAVQREILDPRELRYLLRTDTEFISDLNLLRRRSQQLSDAPRLTDCCRLPDRDTINRLLSLNRACRNQLQKQQLQAASDIDAIHAACRDYDHLYKIWDCARDARCEFYYVTVRRQALKRVCELIGRQVFESGSLPPCVPLWRAAASDWTKTWVALW